MIKALVILLAVLAACAANAQAQSAQHRPLSANRAWAGMVWPGKDAALSLDLFNDDRSSGNVLVAYVDPQVERQVGSFVQERPARLPSRDFQDVNLDNRHRAWGLSVAFRTGPVMVRLAHQNKHVSTVAPYMTIGNPMDAKNSIIAANIKVGAAKLYAAYGINRGWGSSPLWNPDNPYSAALSAMPSTDSRDVMAGVAIPYGRVTLLASFIRKNDRNLANRDADQLAFGLSRPLSRQTDVYAAYSYTHVLKGAGFAAGSGMAPGSGVSAINIGMRHYF